LRLFRWIGRLFPFNYIGDLFALMARLIVLGRRNVALSIRLQLIFTFCVCLAASTFVYAVLNAFFGEINRAPILDYRNGVSAIDGEAQDIARFIKYSNPSQQRIKEYIDQQYQYSQYQIMLVDLEGKVLYRTANATHTQVDIHNLISNAMNSRYSNISRAQEFTSVYPVDVQGQKSYLVLTGIPQPSIYYNRGSSPLTLLIAIGTFIFLFYWLTKRKMAYIEQLAKGLSEISKGNLDYRLVEKSEDELGSLAGSINRMAGALQLTIEEERKAERTKNELITNVSHDLRTPLTLIMGYLRLIKDKNYEDEKQAETYINIAYSKSEKLKGLIDDLFEYTKLSNQGVRLHQERVNLNELLEQLTEELVTLAEENELVLLRDIPAEKIMVSIDAHKMIRVFENLLTNAIKYSLKPGSVKVRMTKAGGSVTVCITNFGEPISAEELPRLFDRFYRVDASRTSATGGSGLGLAIAKSIVESHDGEIWAESEGHEIRFYVKLRLS